AFKPSDLLVYESGKVDLSISADVNYLFPLKVPDRFFQYDNRRALRHLFYTGQCKGQATLNRIPLCSSVSMALGRKESITSDIFPFHVIHECSIHNTITTRSWIVTGKIPIS